LDFFQFKIKRICELTNKGISDLVNAVYKGYWKYAGITSWNDLLEYVFGKINFTNKNIRVNISE